jgi:hypothetical protein
MPYRIPYETYTPNYPQIPGVANSFAQPPYGGGQGYTFGDPMSGAPMGGGYGEADHGHPSERNVTPQFMGGPQLVDRANADRQSQMLPGFDYNRFEQSPASQRAQWNPASPQAPNPQDVVRSATLPAPIGTRRPSHGDDLGLASQRMGGPQNPMDRFTFGRQGSISGGRIGDGLNKNTNNPEDTPRQRESIDESVPRGVRPVDRFFGGLSQGEGVMKER